jgi:hypothetical protein
MLGMATDAVRRDEYAGWHGAGLSFALCGVAAAAIAAAAWVVERGLLPGLRVTQASDQLFLSAVAWVGGGVGVLMGLAVFGSLLLSSRSRGIVVVDDLGVERQLGGRTRRLAWTEMEGFVSGASGVTLVGVEGMRPIDIPRSVEDFRWCVAEIRAHHLQPLPMERLQRKWSWKRSLGMGVLTAAWTLAWDARGSHQLRITAASVLLAGQAWLLLEEDDTMAWSRWVARAVVLGSLGVLLVHMAHSW